MKLFSLAFILLFSLGISVAQTKKSGVPHIPLSIGAVYELRSVILSETRKLNIYLPDGYNESDTTRYPVIYLLDGGLDEDFIHVTGLVQFNSLPWVARMPQSIVVGITNVDRKRDYSFPTTVANDKKKYPTTGGSAKFIAFIEQELHPYIQQNFRITHDRTLIGESLGGLLATEILFTHPALFNKYIIISPSIWWDNGSLLKKEALISTKQATQKTDIYIGTGKEGLAPTEEPHVMEVDANLLKEKIEAYHNPRISVYLDYLPEETHATISHQAIFNAIKVIYKGWNQQ